MSTTMKNPFTGVLKSRLAFTRARTMRGILPLFPLKTHLLTKSKRQMRTTSPPARAKLSKPRPLDAASG